MVGLRIYDVNIISTDQSESKALSYKKELIDIYSNSWGPGDMGWQVEGPGPLLTKALKDGTRLVGNYKTLPTLKSLRSIALRILTAHNFTLD